MLRASPGCIIIKSTINTTYRTWPTNCSDNFQDTALGFLVPGLRKWVTPTSSVTPSTPRGDFSEVEGQVRPTEETNTCSIAGRRGPSRMKRVRRACYEQRPAGQCTDDKPAVTFDEHFDGGFQFQEVPETQQQGELRVLTWSNISIA